jgi:thiamine biosynthesis lipoprotein
MLALLRSRGIRAAMVVAGGEVALGAPPPGKSGWRVAVATPDTGTGNPTCALLLHDIAISTSGDAHQYLELNGRRFSHVINPSTGFALEGLSSTTVIARDSTTADALGTALSVMPVADGIRLAESLDGVAVLSVRKDGNRWKRQASRRFPSSCLGPK